MPISPSQAIVAPLPTYIIGGQVTPPCVELSNGSSTWLFPGGYDYMKQQVIFILNNCSEDLVVNEFLMKEKSAGAKEFSAPSEAFSYIFVTSKAEKEEFFLSLSFKYASDGNQCSNIQLKKYPEDTDVLICKDFTVPPNSYAAVRTFGDPFRISGKLKGGEEVKIEAILVEKQ